MFAVAIDLAYLCDMSFGEVKIIDIPKICDPRGNLSFLEAGRILPFELRRVYWIYDVPGGKKRFGHAFRTQQEVIVSLSGSFDVVLDDGVEQRRYHMARRTTGCMCRV